VLRVCITPTDSLDDGRILGAVQEPVIATRDGTRETLIPEIESYGGLVFYINYGVSQSRIDEIADALAKSAPEVERVVQVKILRSKTRVHRPMCARTVRPSEEQSVPGQPCGEPHPGRRPNVRVRRSEPVDLRWGHHLLVVVAGEAAVIDDRVDDHQLDS